MWRSWVTEGMSEVNVFVVIEISPGSLPRVTSPVVSKESIAKDYPEQRLIIAFVSALLFHHPVCTLGGLPPLHSSQCCVLLVFPLLWSRFNFAAAVLLVIKFRIWAFLFVLFFPVILWKSWNQATLIHRSVFIQTSLISRWAGTKRWFDLMSGCCCYSQPSQAIGI